MYGTYEQKFASLKLFYAYMYAHPGKKLLFMGSEFGQFIEWRFAEQLDWLLFDYESHTKLNDFVKDLNFFYKNNKSMHENDADWNGFSWINESDSEHSVISFIRTSKSKRDKTIVVANFAATEYKKYEVGVPTAGNYTVALNTDDSVYGGSNQEKLSYKAVPKKSGKFRYSISLNLPELSALYIKKERNQSKKK